MKSEETCKTTSLLEALQDILDEWKIQEDQPLDEWESGYQVCLCNRIADVKELLDTYKVVVV